MEKLDSTAGSKEKETFIITTMNAYLVNITWVVSVCAEVVEKVTTLERRMEILSDAYDYETGQLQLIINKIFGFHLTLVREPTNQIRLQSVYTNTDDAFVFQVTKMSRKSVSYLQ